MNAPNGGDPTSSIPQIVTVKDVYTLVTELKDSVAEHNLPDMKSDIKDHESRIRMLEKWVWRASGLAALAGAFISQVVTEFLAK